MSTRSVHRVNRPLPNRPTGGSTRYPRLASSPEPSSGAGRNLYAIVLVDAVSSALLTSHGQLKLRRDLYDLVNGALRRRGFGLSTFPFSDTGDGLRVFVPFNRVRPTEVVDMFVLGLIAELRQHRRSTTGEARVRVRVAFDFGLVEPHLEGWAGDPLVRVARLIDAEPLREVLRSDQDLDLVAVVSDVMFQSVVQPGDGYVAPDCFRPIHVRVKEFDARAWLLTPCASWRCGSFNDEAA